MKSAYSDCSFVGVDGVWLDGLEFCARVYEMYRAQRRQPDAVTRWRSRTDQFEKKLAEELLPMARYIQAEYRTGRYISFCWLSGSQSFDAEFRQCGEYVEQYRLPVSGYIEVTGAMHANDHLLRERINLHGHAYSVAGLSVTGTKRDPSRRVESLVVSYTNGEFIAAMALLVLDSISNKARKAYPKHTTLIVHCTLNNLYFADEWQQLVESVRLELPKHSFVEIWLCDSDDHHHSSLGRWIQESDSE